jgi:RNA polymerase sigma factor (sigma-70 family)
MESYRYLIVGGGMTADAACRGIRELDRDGTIGLVSEEAHPPYARPPLSKALWNWAYKFALLEAAVKLRRRLWQGREVPLEPETWTLFSSAELEPDEEMEQSELLRTLQELVATVLTPHQRRVLVALALNDVPIDVLAERLNTTRGALYKTLHDARSKLRRHLEESGLSLAT